MSGTRLLKAAINIAAECKTDPKVRFNSSSADGCDKHLSANVISNRVECGFSMDGESTRLALALPWRRDILQELHEVVF
jgi:hypothetical protein